MGTQEKTESLISLKLVLFLFYGGLGALYCTLTPHMNEIGLNYEESRLILILAPLVSIIGPLVAGPLADRIASRTLSGKYLRILAALALICSAILYSLLLIVPPLERSEARRPLVSFGCDSSGAIIFQERCTEEKTCFHWKDEKQGSLILTNCSYTCQNPTQFENLYNPWEKGSPIPPTETSKERSDDYEYEDSAQNEYATSEERGKREIKPVYVEPPHLCTKTVNEKGEDVINKCHVYTEDSDTLPVQATLRSATNQENDTHSAEWCNYPLDGWKCNIPKQQASWMKLYMNNSKCKPMVECEVVDPYDSPGSVLADSQCIKIIGDVDATLTSYFVIRLLAEIFPTAAVTLLNAAIIIATRETSTGRGDIGRQLAFGSLGWATFPFILGMCGVQGQLLWPVVVFAIAMIVAAMILIVAEKMPVSPPEWWWHTKSGMLAIPMSAIRKYGPEIAAITLVAVVLGVFWSIIDSYQMWMLLNQHWTNGHYVLKFSLTVLALPSILLLWNSERLVDYCGHSNILMIAFTLYVIRYYGLALVDDPFCTLFFNALEPITLSISWVTLMLYMRHLMPRRLTATGQAIPVIAFFGVGKCIGALIGYVNLNDVAGSFKLLYVSCSVAAAVVAALYFLLYHCCLAPRCAAQPQPPPSQSELQGHANGGHNGNSNGNYSPLRVYHNGMSRKGQFRY